MVVPTGLAEACRVLVAGPEPSVQLPTAALPEASVAGVPKPVVRQAQKYLQLLEDSALTRGNQDDLFARKVEKQPEPVSDPLRDEMLKVNPDELTPREALELLYRLKKL